MPPPRELFMAAAACFAVFIIMGLTRSSGLVPFLAMWIMGALAIILVLVGAVEAARRRSGSKGAPDHGP